MCDGTLVKQQFEKISFLEKEIEELKKRLNLYEHPHIPSSKRIIKQPEEPSTPRKRGAPKGHQGDTRTLPTPTRIVHLPPLCCQRCRGKNFTILKQRAKTVEDIEIVKTVTRFCFYDVLCNGCGKEFTTTSPDLPKRGAFGPSIASLWSMLHYYGTIPFERLSLISGNCFDVAISPQGMHNAIYRSAGIFDPYYKRIENRIISSEYVKSDETSYPFNDEKWWLWNISTPADTLVKIRNSRGSKVLKELFGVFLDGVLLSDCFSAYEKFKAREYQKCWAHILTAAKDLAKHSEEGKELHRKLLRMYRYIRRAKKEGQEHDARTVRWIGRQKQEILSWIEKEYESKAVMNLALRMSKYLDQWFTCLKYPEVEPTNNGSERDIRKNVIARKISGAHRSTQGVHAREVMMSTLLTQQKRQKNPFEFVRRSIERYNSRV